MAICHATENVLEPVFPDLKSVFLSKATLSLASFEPVDNCPHLQQLRNDHTIPWAITLADFTK